MSAPLPRVAVLGVPRGGTSAVVGLLRILGWVLPERGLPDCVRGEVRGLRLLDPDHPVHPQRIAERVDALPDGVVWKDPGVGDYAGLIDWPRWRTVSVIRNSLEVAESERRHGYMLPIDRHQVTALTRYRRTREALADQGRAADIVLPFEGIRRSPAATLDLLATLLGVDQPSPEQRAAAREFVQSTGGYRCPLPQTCPHSH